MCRKCLWDGVAQGNGGGEVLFFLRGDVCLKDLELLTIPQNTIKKIWALLVVSKLHREFGFTLPNRQ